MGLLMDANGIPLAYDLFPGNESEKLHMRPIINRVKTQFSDTRTIFVADRGLNTSDNIYYLNGDNRGDSNERDGYVYGQSVREADEDKIKEQELYDGYYSIVTSELELDDLRIREIYRGLAQIEDTFKVSKTDIHSRPLYVWTNKHIEAHFATCFTALVLIRLLQNRLEKRYPVERILTSLKKYCCVNLDTNTYQFVYFDEILQDCSNTFNISMNEKYKTRLRIRRMLRY